MAQNHLCLSDIDALLKQVRRETVSQGVDTAFALDARFLARVTREPLSQRAPEIARMPATSDSSKGKAI